MADLMSKKSFVEKNISMSAQSPLHLTEGQKACLRLVGQHYTSKEIARTLGISPFTVDPTDLDVSQSALPDGLRQKFAKIFSFISAPPIGGERHELSSREIFVLALNIAFFSTLVMAFVVVVLTGTFRLFQ